MTPLLIKKENLMSVTKLEGVLIIGAGIGGLSTAIALAQKGISFTILERTANVSTYGAGIVCWPNATMVLKTLNCFDAVLSKGNLISTMERLTPQGEKLSELSVDQLNTLMNNPSIAILRKDIIGILWQRAVKLGVSFQYNQQVSDYSTTKDGFSQVTCNNNAKWQANLTIASDGRMSSMAREVILGNNKTEDSKVINLVGVTKHEHNQDLTKVQDYWGTGKRFGWIPIDAETSYWAAGISIHIIKDKQKELTLNEWQQSFSDWPEIVNQSLTLAKEQGSHCISVHDHNPAPSWHKDNLIMMGDAAHAALPTSGQGACQALEDALWWSEVGADLVLSLKRDQFESLGKKFFEARANKTTIITMAGRQLSKQIFFTPEENESERNKGFKNADPVKAIEGMAEFWRS